MAAQVSIPLPFTPVPFTLQPMVVLVGAAVLGARLGMASQILYLALGVAGLPVFALSPLLPEGVARLVGPTGGYLLSYPFAAFVVGALAERGFDRRYLTAVLAMAAGLASIYAAGVAWLAFVARPGARPVRRDRRRLRAVRRPRRPEDRRGRRRDARPVAAHRSRRPPRALRRVTSVRTPAGTGTAARSRAT